MGNHSNAGAENESPNFVIVTLHNSPRDDGDHVNAYVSSHVDSLQTYSNFALQMTADPRDFLEPWLTALGTSL